MRNTICKNTDRNIIVLTLGFGGKDSACFGSRDWPETPSFFRCVSVPEYCSCTRKNIRIKIRIKYNIKLLKGTQYIYVSFVAVMMNIELFKAFKFLHTQYTNNNLLENVPIKKWRI